MRVDVVLELKGREIRTNACIDTGFTGEAGFRVPRSYLWIAGNDTYDLRQEDSNGELDWVPTSFDAKLIRINGVDVSQEAITAFQDGDSLVGAEFLQTCVLHIDGPRAKALLSLP